MNDYNKDIRKDWRRRLSVRRNEHGAYVVGPSQRHEKFIDGIGSVLYGAGYRYTRNGDAFPGKPHFYLKKHNAVLFACDCKVTDYGIEHDCSFLTNKSAGTLAAIEEDTKLLDLVVSAVEKLGPRVDVVFKCQTLDRDMLRRKLVAFVEGGATYSQRDRMAWFRRQGALSEFGIREGGPKRFLIPAIVLDWGRRDLQRLFLGRIGGSHAEPFSSIPIGIVEGCNTIDIGFIDHSGAFLARDAAAVYGRRHGLLEQRLVSEFSELRADDLNR